MESKKPIIEKGGLIRTFTEDKEREYELYIVDVIGDIVFTKAYIKFPILPKDGVYDTIPLQCYDLNEILFMEKHLEILTKKEREDQESKEIDESLKE